MPLGSLLGPPKALLGGLWTPKTFKHLMFLKVFGNAAFWVFEALDGPLGLILPPSWADLVPKWVQNEPQKLSKKLLKSGPKNDPKIYLKSANFGAPKSIGPGEFLGSFLGSFSGFWPRGLKMAPRWPKRPPRCSQRDPRQG